MPASNLINFKRGTQAQLDQLKTAKKGRDGCFYLVVDETNDISGSSRLYVGRSNGDIVPVNQGIISVTHVSDFPTQITNGTIKAGDFVYATADNVLAVYSNGHWNQLNTDKYIAQLAESITVSNGVATITTTGTYNAANGGSQTISTNFKVTGSNNITVSASDTNDDGINDTLTIEGDTYELTSDHGSNTATIKLSSDHIADAGTITIANATNGNMTITENNGTISLKAADKSVKSLSSDAATINAQGTTVNNHGFTISATTGADNNGATYRTSINPIVAYGENHDQTAYFEGGTATLNVYSKTEIDRIVNQADAMVYRGTVGTGGSASTTVAGITSPKIGDTFKVVGGTKKDGAFTIESTRMANGEATKVYPGDLIIVSGAVINNTPVNTEDSDGIVTGTPKFDVIPSGDDYDTTYTIDNITNGIKILESKNGTQIGSIAVSGGSLITATDGTGTGTGTNKTVTLSHDTITTTKNSGVTTLTEVNNNAGAKIELEVVTGLTDDSHGHVTDFQTKKLVINTQSDKISNITQTAADSNNVATVSTNITTVAANGTQTSKSVDFDITSSNLTLDTTTTSRTYGSGADATTVQVPVVTMNMYWGTFEADLAAA